MSKALDETADERRGGIDRRVKDDISPDDIRSVGRREDDILETAAPVIPDDHKAAREEDPASLRRRCFLLVAVGGGQGRLSRWFDIGLISLISLNVLAVILESVDTLEAAYHGAFYVFEVFSVAVFSVEYLLRLWTIVESSQPEYRHPLWGRLRYMISPMALVDLVAVVPFYLGFFLTADLRFMRVLRLLRVFKLTRYSSAMVILLNVLRQEARSFGAALFVLLLLMIFSASMIYLFEHQVQPEAFSSIPKAMWWAVITLTTVGYGDILPITPLGRLFGAAISIIGIGMVALPAGILSSGFSQQLRLRRQEYRSKVKDALADGRLSYEDVRQLTRARTELGLSVEEAHNILRRAAKGGPPALTYCPECGASLEVKGRSRSESSP